MSLDPSSDLYCPCRGNLVVTAFAFLMASMAMKYADTATINRPTANATPSINIIFFPFTHRAMDTLRAFL